MGQHTPSAQPDADVDQPTSGDRPNPAEPGVQPDVNEPGLDEGFVFPAFPATGPRLDTVVNPERREAGSAEPAAGDPVDPSDSILWGRLFPALSPDGSSAVSPAASPAGIQIGHFIIEERIGTGGMGAVFRALDTRLQRIVALKILGPGPSRDGSSVKRFQNEARAAARLDHDNIARVFFIGEDKGLHFIAFEYVTGINLRDLIRQNGPLHPAEAVNYTLQVTAALAHTAAAGVVHRDIKPSNIIVTPSGRAKLVDLGLARKKSADSLGDITMAGTTLGTFDYISPEQAKDPRSVDIRSDIYSLGCTLYHMLTGSPPYPDGTVLQKLLDHQGKDPPDPAERNPYVSPELSAVVRRMMATKPRNRYPDPSALGADLLTVAQTLGLRGVHPDGLVWSNATETPPRERFWERNLGWIATAAVLLLIVVLIDRFPQGDRPADNDAVSRRTSDAADATGPNGAAAPLTEPERRNASDESTSDSEPDGGPGLRIPIEPPERGDGVEPLVGPEGSDDDSSDDPLGIRLLSKNSGSGADLLADNPTATPGPWSSRPAATDGPNAVDPSLSGPLAAGVPTEAGSATGQPADRSGDDEPKARGSNDGVADAAGGTGADPSDDGRLLPSEPSRSGMPEDVAGHGTARPSVAREIAAADGPRTGSPSRTEENGSSRDAGTGRNVTAPAEQATATAGTADGPADSAGTTAPTGAEPTNGGAADTGASIADRADDGAAETDPSVAARTDGAGLPKVGLTPDGLPPQPIGVSPPEESRPYWVIRSDGTSESKPTLEAACAAAADGNVIELRPAGPQPQPVRKPIQIKDKKLTIRAADGARPWLEFGVSDPDALPERTRMFELVDASVELVNLDIRLAVPGDSDPDTPWALASLQGRGQIRLDGVTVTVDNPGSAQAAVIELAAGSSEAVSGMNMMKKSAVELGPEFEVEATRCVFRGGADVVLCRHTRPGRISVEQSIVAVEGSLLLSTGNLEMVDDALGNELRLSHTTCVLGGGLIRFDAGETPRDLLPVTVSARNNLIATNTSNPLVSVEGATRADRYTALLLWSGERNAYTGFEVFWSGTALEFAPRDFDAWQRLWTGTPGAKEVDPHTRVVWREAWDRKEPVSMRTTDLRLDEEAANNPAVGGATNGTNVGADVTALPEPPRLAVEAR